MVGQFSESQKDSENLWQFSYRVLSDLLTNYFSNDQQLNILNLNTQFSLLTTQTLLVTKITALPFISVVAKR
jgi:hypothetical protein